MRKASVGALLLVLGASAVWAPPWKALSLGLVHAPRIALPGPAGANAGWSSTNWSGYALSGSGYTKVTGQWTVPAVSVTRKSTYSSSWIGIDGFNNSNLIQTGTEQDSIGGTTKYDAWWEILPAAETIIPSLTIHPGDKMSASIVKGSGTLWTISLSDTTTGQTFSIQKTYTGPQTSAEWIQEAPSSFRGVLPLAHYGTITFDPGTVNGGNPGLVAADGGTMVQNGVQVSTPSTPDADKDGFNAAYGSTAPAPPPS
jgi:hypothetical protein